MKITRKKIISLLGKNGSPADFSSLLEEFGGKSARKELGNLLEEMAGRGQILSLGGGAYASAVAASSGIRGRISLHRDGYGFVTPENGGDDIFIPKRNIGSAMSGDTVQVGTGQGRFGERNREGRVLSIVERGTKRIVGRYEEKGNKAYVIPDDERLKIALLISPGKRGVAENGQQVVAEITSYPGAGRPAEGRISEILGWPDDPEVEVQSVIRRFDLPAVFSNRALEEAEALADVVSERDLKGRVDLRGRLTVTVDGETARDFDDAVSMERDGANFRLRVSIADVSHYVKPGSGLDGDAFLRGTSVYFPDRCLPMLPERLSNGICSLNPGVDRLTVTAEMLIDPNGDVIESDFYPSVIKSSARLTYTIVSGIIEKRDPVLVADYSEVAPMLLEMKELTFILQEMRKKRGSIDFDLPEPEILIGLTGRTEGIIRSERNLAHQLIEEFMLIANESVARFVTAKGLPFLYRIHENPDIAKLRNFQEMAHGFGYELPINDERVEPHELQRILSEAEGKPEERMINYSLLRCMKQARYSPENMGHFGLASSCYCHFTSPIRRYPDLVVHRILKTALRGKGAGRSGDKSVENLSQIAEHTSRRERVATDAERDIIELRKVQFMQQHLGKEFDGYICGVASFGFFVELDEFFVEGMVHLSTLEDDYYSYVEKMNSLVGMSSRRVFRLGDRVRIKVLATYPSSRRIEFVLACKPGDATGKTSSPHSASPEGYFRIPLKGKQLSEVLHDRKPGKKSGMAKAGKVKAKRDVRGRRGKR